MFGMRKKRVSLEQKKTWQIFFVWIIEWLLVGWRFTSNFLVKLTEGGTFQHRFEARQTNRKIDKNWKRTNAIRLVRDRNASVWREIQTFGARSERDKINAKILKFCWTTSTTATSWSRTRCQSLMGVRPTPPWWGRYRLEWPARSWPSRGSCGSPSPAWTSVSWWERI